MLNTKTYNNTQTQQSVDYKTNNTKTTIARQGISYDGKPLDFSFKQIKNLEELKTLEPRSGERKPPPQDIDDYNKEEIKQQEVDEDEEIKQNENETQSQKEEVEGDNNNNNINDNSQQQNDNQKNSNKDKKDEKKIENKQPQVIRIIPTQNTQNFQAAPTANNNSVNAKAIQNGILVEGGAGKQKSAHKVTLVCASLILSYNKIRSISNFKLSADYVMMGDWRKNLQWIDLSHNYIESLDYNFADLPNLKSLYLHCNYLSNLEELIQLQELPIRSLTIHGNPIETINQFRLYIIGILPYLKRLDSVLVSKKERDNCNVWFNVFNRKLPSAVKDARKPPSDNNISTQKQ
ncbi:hypothetical protein PPERSA_11619 [Pseudocohnilembus persalinus]|uniref:Leucine-rich repeat-containing protein 51 n=1 Tax=Pseudocohnilembus persalinus TaxID=266149 RepID=A0A0V0QA32_PSEPJ|nr:hypothetical protein PPERSA_11619 [Pseudocohnilembus persalinus]|eukprot:KRW99018.1 hypothetical protein PPERSA_11619 [Pseudocohnilembus persalinus]